MKLVSVAVLALTIAGCASNPTYVHDAETHRRSVERQLPVMIAGIYQPTLVQFTVRQDGRIDSISADGVLRGDRSRAVYFVENAGPFAPHMEPEPIEYSIVFGGR